ncbi:DNA mismatch endonuclease Vsr [Burkholderia multivorans]|uniref:very short patch repair endonuclease n=1 Tax=Burkholderia multivorans TaxID=87883 RepID=UPI0019BF9751|nr:very short patch repair endonuclease [Burkholderia multivorans]MBU9333422.1 very short patch repair endonuclease [Burkholderia multivorans]CAB5279042.1 DNA mismatch endonuclease Vsr [Burkholderia multivorans]CAB5285198.1 DNA mismatch endonuclease Vsr [Burkholderia multivorans]CAB5287483.1 DNA mismatch endonuclease Vsr [Burkholderia multivorans]CAB5288360.1 DNA mismatch endonuclease Vsr [Burkholderia multivorans]
MPVGRSENMRRIRSKNTGPEMAVRQLLRGLGFTGYRLHRKELPGKPDIAFVGRKKAIMIHGCFWHGHDCKEGLRRPKSNADYWIPKISRNQARDAEHAKQLTQMEWSVLTVWECELRDLPTLAHRLLQFLAKESDANE